MCVIVSSFTKYKFLYIYNIFMYVNNTSLKKAFEDFCDCTRV